MARLSSLTGSIDPWEGAGAIPNRISQPIALKMGMQLKTGNGSVKFVDEKYRRIGKGGA